MINSTLRASSNHRFYFSVDANVGKSLFHNAILGLIQQGKTVILVTHALHFLSQCDYIYTVEGGRISEHGSYQALLDKKGEFARLDKEFGGGIVEAESDENLITVTVTVEDLKVKSARAAGTGKIEGKLITKEKRTTGSVSWKSVFFTSIFIYTDAPQFMGAISKPDGVTLPSLVSSWPSSGCRVVSSPTRIL